MTEKERENLLLKAWHAERDANKLRWYWLSFTGDSGFRGSVVIRGFGPLDCIRNAHLLGQNPGGEVMAMLIPDHELLPPKNMRNRLLSMKEMVDAGLDPVKVPNDMLEKARVMDDDSHASD